MHLGLPLGALAQRQRAEVDALSLWIDPAERAAVFAHLHFCKGLRLLQKGEISPAHDHRPQIDDAGVIIVPHDLEHAGDDGFDRDDPRNVGHWQLPLFSEPYRSSTSRAGSSRQSLTRTRKVTASRPSTIR